MQDPNWPFSANQARAISYYERAMKNGSLSARNNLAWLLATCADAEIRNGARAIALIKPIALLYGNWQHLDTLASALAEQGNFAEAVSAQQEALEKIELNGVGDDDALSTSEMRSRLELFKAGSAFIE